MGEVIQFRPKAETPGAERLQRRLQIGHEIAQIAIEISLLEGRRAQLEKELENDCD